jgi:hypothetical protein
MSDIELKQSATEISADAHPETVESSDRRAFIKGTVMVAGAVAASHLAASSANAAPEPASEPLQGTPTAGFARQPVAVMQINFDRRRPPSVQEIQALLPAIFRLTGCVACGLIGLDLRIGINEVLPTLQEGVNLNLEGTLAGR